MDIGDIEATAELWPLEVKQGFDKINWFDNFKQYENERKTIESQKKR